MVLVLGCPSVLVLPKEKPVFWVVVAWPNGLLKRLVVCWFCCPKRPPGFAPNPVVPFRKKEKKESKNKWRGKTPKPSNLTLLSYCNSLITLKYLSYPTFIHDQEDNHFTSHPFSPNLDLVQTLIPTIIFWPQQLFSSCESKTFYSTRHHTTLKICMCISTLSD